MPLEFNKYSYAGVAVGGFMLDTAPEGHVQSASPDNAIP